VPTRAGFLYLAIVFEALKSPCERLEYTAVEFRSARLQRAIPAEVPMWFRRPCRHKRTVCVPDFCPDCREKFLAVVGWIAPALESTLSPAPPEPITTPEDTLRRAGISSERQAAYQRRMSSLLAGRR